MYSGHQEKATGDQIKSSETTVLCVPSPSRASNEKYLMVFDSFSQRYSRRYNTAGFMSLLEMPMPQHTNITSSRSTKICITPLRPFVLLCNGCIEEDSCWMSRVHLTSRWWILNTQRVDSWKYKNTSCIGKGDQLPSRNWELRLEMILCQEMDLNRGSVDGFHKAFFHAPLFVVLQPVAKQSSLYYRCTSAIFMPRKKVLPRKSSRPFVLLCSLNTLI